jgi:alpha-1,3-rhamnosyltransferase
MTIKNEPLVSIVIPCYNHENYVQDCIQSIINQTYKNIELIIIDDGSNDNSIEKILEMVPSCEKRFSRFEFRYRHNVGLSATLNEALEWCEGEYYSCIASDDQMLSDKIFYQVSYLLNNQNIIACFGNVKLINENNKIIKIENYPNRSYDFEEIFLNQHHINASTQMIRMSALKKVGGYKAGIAIEDLYMWLKLSEIGKIYIDQKVLSNYRLHENNSIKKGKFIYEGCLDVINLYRDHHLYLKAIKKIFWTYIVSLAINDKEKSLVFLKSIISDNFLEMFSRDFLRFARNYILK